MNAGTPIPEPARLSLRLKALRTIPNFRGKSRLARTLLSSKERKRCVLIQDRFGNHMIVPNMVEPVGFSLGVNGSYEPDLVNLLRRHSAKGRDFIDVGANVGAFTVVLAGLSRRVIAIEASPAMLPFLRRNIELNHAANVDVVACAVSDRGIDSVPFYVPPMDHFGMGSSAAQFGVEPVTVAARTMDQVWLDLGAGPVGSVKVDVEGFEAHAFLGATALLDSHIPRWWFLSFAIGRKNGPSRVAKGGPSKSC